jgi:hypothetical protein
MLVVHVEIVGMGDPRPPPGLVIFVGEGAEPAGAGDGAAERVIVEADRIAVAVGRRLEAPEIVPGIGDVDLVDDRVRQVLERRPPERVVAVGEAVAGLVRRGEAAEQAVRIALSRLFSRLSA